MPKRSRSPLTPSRPSSPSSSTSPPPERSKVHLPDTVSDAVEVMRCSLPPHRGALSFASYEDYEVHYLQAHVNRCAECGKNFPTGHFLGLHIEENHDPLAGARRERGEKTYGCFIEDCDRKCSTPQKRRWHLIDKHMFPPTYNFYIVNHGIDRQTSLLRPKGVHRRHVSASTGPEEGRLRHRQSPEPDPKLAPERVPGKDDVSKETPSQMEIDELEKSMSALRFVPPSVTKGQGRMGKNS
ncbi:C2H2 type zinc finger [Aspergillus sp. HF37]|nr:C2H2 type zinc finger [Aspergillus sp. HF37]